MTLTAFDDRTPIYRQIAGHLREDIASGALGDDEQVMSTNQYAAFHRINPATAAKAFAQLVDEGVVYKRRGVGIFVSPGARERLLAARRETFFADVVEPVAEQARLLGVPIEDVVARLRSVAGHEPSPSAGTREGR